MLRGFGLVKNAAGSKGFPPLAERVLAQRPQWSLAEESRCHRPAQHPQTWEGAGRETEAQGEGSINSSDGQARGWAGTVPGSPWAPRTQSRPAQSGGGSGPPGGAGRCDSSSTVGVCDVGLAGKRAKKAAFYGSDLVRSDQVFQAWLHMHKQLSHLLSYTTKNPACVLP